MRMMANPLGNVHLDRPIFVLGHPRSGTTLVASMLGRHPEIASTPETLYLTEGQFQLAPFLSRGAAAVGERMQNTRLRHLPFTSGEIAQLLSGLPHLTERSVFAALLLGFQQLHNRPRVLEKSPVHIRHIDEILDWFPDARIIWVVRDGRACVSSLLKVTWASKNPVVLARQWVRNMSFALASEKRAGAQLLRVSYEALIADTASQIKRIEAFTEVPHSELVLDHTVKVETISSFESSWKDNVNKPIITGRIDAWQYELTPHIITQLSPIMDPMLKRLGYAPSMSGGVMLRMTEWLRGKLLYSRAGVELMRRGYRAQMRKKGLALALSARSSPHIEP